MWCVCGACGVLCFVCMWCCVCGEAWHALSLSLLLSLSFLLSLLLSSLFFLPLFFSFLFLFLFLFLLLLLLLLLLFLFFLFFFSLSLLFSPPKRTDQPTRRPTWRHLNVIWRRASAQQSVPSLLLSPPSSLPLSFQRTNKKRGNVLLQEYFRRGIYFYYGFK